MTAMDTVAAALQMAIGTLLNHSDSPRLDAEILLCQVLKVSRSALIVRGADPIAVEPGKETKVKNTARAAAVAFFNAIEGNDKQPPADRAEVLSWVAVLLTESPLAAEVITEAVETHLDAMTAAQSPVSKVA